MEEKQRNIRFLTKQNKIQYNALKIFRNKRIVKIPDYVIDEVFITKSELEIYYKGKLLKTYSYDNLNNFLLYKERRRYEGGFRDKDILYRLQHVDVT